MNIKKVILLGLFLLHTFCGRAQTWNLALGAPTNENWNSITVSANGSNAAASTLDGLLYTSMDGGLTWTQRSIPAYRWQLASSADGSTLFAGGSQLSSPYIGPMYYSTNAGITWVNTGLAFKFWTGMAMTPDGKKIVAVDNLNNVLWLSSDGGSSWSTNNSPVSFPVLAAISGDGAKILVMPERGTIYSSFDGGMSWISNTIPSIAGWGAAAVSLNGSRLLAGVGGNGGAIYTSTNSGAVWISNNVPLNVWYSAASSADGRQLIAGTYPGIFTSANGGLDWISNNVPSTEWTAVATSADGSRMFAGGFPGGIYTLQISPAPQLILDPTNGRISWTVPATNFVLQQSSDLTGSNWKTISDPPVLNYTNLRYEVTVPLSGSNGFFRLSSRL